MRSIRIDKGHFGTLPLAGLSAALLYAWPGPIYEGNGEIQAIIDERANADQRRALETVFYGGETDEGRTHWWVYRAMSSTVHPPIFKPIEFEVKIEARTARVRIPGILESTGRPIRSPATGAEHRVRIDIPDGIEFEIAEIGSATTKTLWIRAPSPIGWNMPAGRHCDTAPVPEGLAGRRPTGTGRSTLPLIRSV